MYNNIFLNFMQFHKNVTCRLLARTIDSISRVLNINLLTKVDHCFMVRMLTGIIYTYLKSIEEIIIKLNQIL